MFENELKTELLGVNALNFASDNNSSSRAQMFSSHFSQRLTIEGATENRIQTGAEQEFAKYVFSVKMPVTGRVISVIDRYPTTLGEGSIPANPESYLIYEDIATGEVGCLSIPKFISYHQYFGFELKPTDHMIKLVSNPSQGTIIEKDTVLMQPSSVSHNGGYKYGIMLNVCFMSHPAVAEDGILISEDVLPRLRFKVYEKRVVEFGKNSYPLNLYGDLHNYKPFPEIGDEVRSDGLLMMLRTIDEDIAPVDLSIYDAREPDFIFDKAVYGRGPYGKVIDVRVYHNEDITGPTPTNMMSSMNKYDRAMRGFYQEVLDITNKLAYERKKKLGVSKLDMKPELHQLVLEALVHLDNNGSMKRQQKLNLEYRKNPLDEYRIEFVIEHTITPTTGFKLTGLNGDKGVICRVEKPENMPIDMNGNRADIVMDDRSTIARTNLGRLYQPYINAAARDVTQTIRKQLNTRHQKGYKLVEEVKNIYQTDPHAFAGIYNWLTTFYGLVNDQQKEVYQNASVDDQIQHIADVIEDGIYFHYPIENQKEKIDVVKNIERLYPPVYGPISYVDGNGNRITTKKKVRIAPMYMMLLEKIADDWSSVASGRLQHFGVLSPMTKSEKYATPWRNSPVRTVCESGYRILASYCGREAIAEIMDRNNNPITHKQVVWNILSSATPGNIKEVVDRNVVPLGGSKPLQLFKHFSMCAGFEVVYEPEDMTAPVRN